MTQFTVRVYPSRSSSGLTTVCLWESTDSEDREVLVYAQSVKTQDDEHVTLYESLAVVQWLLEREFSLQPMLPM